MSVGLRILRQRVVKQIEVSVVKVKKILVVGGGSIGRRHVRVARQLRPDSQIMVLSMHPGMNLPEGATGYVSSMAQALAFEADVAVIANASTAHIDSANSLLAGTVHLLLEKPISATAQGVEALIARCQERSLNLMVGYNLRYSESLQAMRQAIEAGQIGQVLSVRAEVGQFLPQWRTDVDYRASVSARSELGGGVLLELSHEIDYLLWLFGDVEWIQSYCGRHSALEIDVEDIAHILMRFEADGSAKGAVASIVMDFFRKDTRRNCCVVGSEGTLNWDAITGSVTLHEGGANQPRQLFQQQAMPDDTYVAEWQQFLAKVEGGASDQTDARDALRVVRIIEAAKKSTDQGLRMHKIDVVCAGIRW
jgi:predicted dehydrogenase